MDMTLSKWMEVQAHGGGDAQDTKEQYAVTRTTTPKIKK
jgi:hypothetical protein